jgi:serine/threonine protein kinase
MVAAAEALDQLHLRGVSHNDIREPNILILPGRQEPFPIRFIDFGVACTFPGDEIASEYAKHAFEQDSHWFVRLLADYFGLSQEAARPILRTIPRQGAIVKFLEAWAVHPTYEEQLKATIALTVRYKNCNEERAREMVMPYVS